MIQNPNPPPSPVRQFPDSRFLFSLTSGAPGFRYMVLAKLGLAANGQS